MNFVTSGIHFIECEVTMFDSKVSNNIVGDGGISYLGGGIYFYKSNSTLINVKVLNNQSGTGGVWYHGAGIYSSESNLILNNVLIVSNVMGNLKEIHMSVGYILITVEQSPFYRACKCYSNK